MDINTIVDAWERKKLSPDIETLNAWKKIVDKAEQEAFEGWRVATCKAECSKLVDDHIKYHLISIGIRDRINKLQFDGVRQRRSFLETLI